jgi:hypothetical protein
MQPPNAAVLIESAAKYRRQLQLYQTIVALEERGLVHNADLDRALEVPEGYAVLRVRDAIVFNWVRWDGAVGRSLLDARSAALNAQADERLRNACTGTL